jgi:NADP-dependent alcohol dehydrogenase
MKNGVYENVISSLKGYDITEFGGIEPNPTYETLMKAVAIVKENNIDFILAVGGGSIIDGTKFIAAAANYEGTNPWEILSKGAKVKSAIPFGTVLTLPATGSEMNSGSVISKTATNEKMAFGSPLLFPKFSITDPTVIQSLPLRQIQNGVIDAYVHVLEQYLTYPSNAFLQDRISESILQTLIEIGPKIIKNPADYITASNFMWCCTMALNGLIAKGVPTDWATHMIGHELTALHGLDHAQSLAVIGPNLYTVQFNYKKEKLTQYGKRVWNLTGTDDEIARKAITTTQEFYQNLGVKTKLSSYTNTFQETSKIISKRFKERGWIGLGEHKNINLEKVEEIVEMSY